MNEYYDETLMKEAIDDIVHTKGETNIYDALRVLNTDVLKWVTMTESKHL